MASLTKTYNNIDSLLKTNVSSVVICTPAETHGELVKKAINAKKLAFI